MRRFALVLLTLALVVGGLTVHGIASARLEVTIIKVDVLQASQYLEAFDNLAQLHAAGAVRGLVYDEAPLGPAEDYVILRYTLQWENKGFIPARMLEAVVLPLEGDVLCYAQQEAQGLDVNQPIDLAGRSQLNLSCFLLTRNDLPAVRDLQVSYYIWGNPFVFVVKHL